jgi:F-type H+-transporting ATPase subunit b
MVTTNLAAGNFLIPNGTFIAELLAFLIILAVLWRYVVPPVTKAMNDRQTLIKSQLEEGQRASERLKEAEADYRKALEEARATAATIRDQARADAAGIREDILARAAQERDRIIESGRDQLTTERQALVRELRAELGNLAVELAGRILGESLVDEARQRGTVDRFLEQLQEEEAGAAGRR